MAWYTKYCTVYEKNIDEVSDSVFYEVKQNIARIQNQNPLVTISVIGYNEEKHLLSCLWSLSDTISKYPIEIIGVDNDSKDRTAEIFERCGIPYYKETKHSCGHARACGLKHARGKYHLNIDSDTMYPPHYAEIMVESLLKQDTVAVCSLWSYMPDKNHSWLAIKVYEACRDFYLWAQHFKRPELAVRGLVFGYDTELGKKVGIRTDIIRGEDGSLALGLKKYGRIRFIHNRKARAVTGYGTVSADGSFTRSFYNRIVMRLKGITSIFSSRDHYEDETSNLVK